MDDVNLPSFDELPLRKRNPTRRKEITKRRNCLWLDKDIHFCVKERNTNSTKYRDLKKATGLSLSTIWTKVKALNNGGQIRPKQGPKFKVPLQNEKEMVKFLNECSEQGDPRTEEEVSADICHFLKCYQFENTFKKGKPGRGYFRRYRHFYPDATILSVDEKRLRLLQITPSVQWLFNRDRYLMENHDSFCTSFKAIVIVEAFELIALNCDIEFKILGAYNADGEIINMVVVHGGEIQDDLQQFYNDRLQFVLSDDGDISFDAVGMAVQEVYRMWLAVKTFNVVLQLWTFPIHPYFKFMRDEQIPKPILMYMPNDVYSCYGYAAWRFVSGVEMKAYRIPSNIFKDALDMKMTLQAKMQSAFDVEITKKFLNKNKEITIDGFLRSLAILTKRGMTRALKIPFNKLQLLTVEPPKPVGEESFVPYIDVDNLHQDEATAREGDVEVYNHIMRHDVYHQHGRPAETSTTETDVTDATQPTPTTSQDNDQQGSAEPVGESIAENDIQQFVETELADGQTLENIYTAGNSILDEFEDPTEFPSDVE